jgi:hypothetical protein
MTTRSKRTLKVFGYILATYGDESARLGQASHVRQCRAIVAATTKKEAAEKFGISMHEANGFMSETGNDEEIALAMSKPGQVFAKPINYSKTPVVIEIERKPHVPFKRAPRMSIDDKMKLWDKQKADREARRFTKEELEYMVEMFEGGNNPVAAAIAERAKLILSEAANNV